MDKEKNTNDILLAPYQYVVRHGDGTYSYFTSINLYENDADFYNSHINDRVNVVAYKRIHELEIRKGIR